MVSHKGTTSPAASRRRSGSGAASGVVSTREARHRRHLEPALDEREGADERVLADDDAVHQDRVHADERVAADRGAVQHGTVADVAVLRDRAVLAGEGMQRAAVLDVAAGTEHDAAEVAAQRGQGADIGTRPDDHVADQDGGRVDEGRGIDHRDQPVDGEDAGHQAAAAGRRIVTTLNRRATKAASVRQAFPAGLAPLT